MSVASVLSSVVSAVTGNTLGKVIGGVVGGLLLAGLLALGVRYVYLRGYAAADTVRRAEVAELQGAHSRALAAAEAEARRVLAAATVRGNALEAEYLAARQTINRQSRELTKEKITHASRDHVVTADGVLRVGPEWVRAYNEAIGAGPGDDGDALPGAAPGPAGPAGPAQTVDAGLVPGADTVTLADILANARDNGERSRAMEAQLNALIDWAEGLREVAR